MHSREPDDRARRDVDDERESRRAVDESDVTDADESSITERDSTVSPAVGERLNADLAGESVGGMGGTLAGAAVGSLGGPIGAIVGAIAGAIGGWWMGREVADEAAVVREADERAYRTHFATTAGATQAQRYEDARAAYVLGHLAALNPDYARQPFEQVEPDLEQGWMALGDRRVVAWSEAREYARLAFLRTREEAQRMATGRGEREA
ncbi:MAG TPA: glycine zipper domain-containing protein [Gemmatimonadaceae bacterium]|nr:glycine zipper domain-containing protein [Gemmatimonadaceae bacterium]